MLTCSFSTHQLFLLFFLNLWTFINPTNDFSNIYTLRKNKEGRKTFINMCFNCSLHEYIHCKQGLCQRDPLSPLFFALASDTLSAMFTHALCSKVLLGVLIGLLQNVSHLQYADDLINFSKICLFSTIFGFQPNEFSVVILNCSRDCLPLTYLGGPNFEEKTEMSRLVETYFISSF